MRRVDDANLACWNGMGVACHDLPAPTTIYLPEGFSGRLRNMAADGAASLTAASNIARNRVRTV
jgi:hypothetical protein